MAAEKKRESFAPPATGGASLLVVFAVLCLTVFALLSLATVQADVRLADASAKAVTDYYAADCAAQWMLARLRSGERPEEVSVSPSEDPALPGELCCYACPVSGTQELKVEAVVNGEDYTVLRWQVVSVGEWEFDDSLSLWDGTPFLEDFDE